MFEFSEILTKFGLYPKQVRLVRHDDRCVAAWHRGGEITFGCFASFQREKPAPYNKTKIACHFLPGPNLPDGSLSALYVGTTLILDEWTWDGQRLPLILDEEIIAGERGRQNVNAFDLEWLDVGREYSERLLINWGPGARAWSQWAHKRPKAIVELRLQAHEPPFPGFSRFISRSARSRNTPKPGSGLLGGEGRLPAGDRPGGSVCWLSDRR